MESTDADGVFPSRLVGSWLVVLATVAVAMLVSTLLLRRGGWSATATQRRAARQPQEPSLEEVRRARLARLANAGSGDGPARSPPPPPPPSQSPSEQAHADARPSLKSGTAAAATSSSAAVQQLPSRPAAATQDSTSAAAPAPALSGAGTAAAESRDPPADDLSPVARSVALEGAAGSAGVSPAATDSRGAAAAAPGAASGLEGGVDVSVTAAPAPPPLSAAFAASLAAVRRAEGALGRSVAVSETAGADGGGAAPSHVASGVSAQPQPAAIAVSTAAASVRPLPAATAAAPAVNDDAAATAAPKFVSRKPAAVNPKAAVRPRAFEPAAAAGRGIDVRQDLAALDAAEAPPGPECRPLHSMEELLAWAPGPDAHERPRRSSVPLPPRPDSGLRADRRRLLLCHDMMGGYQDDRHAQGCDASEAYVHDCWHCVDAFIYFSHCHVTIPPVGWVDAGHANGVPVLGTLITEWDGGRAACRLLFADAAVADAAARQLARIARFYGFDGWLINIENDVDPQRHLPHLMSFLSTLTDLMGDSASGEPPGVVLWYDACDVNGRNNHQSALTALNQPFFTRSHGIFLDYHWTEAMPAQSRLYVDQLASAQPPPPPASSSQPARGPHDVYMGVDVFGRGTFGGGGFNSHRALAVARTAGLSAALFAQGWVFEHGVRAEWRERDRRFWRENADAWQVERAVVVELPFYTAFSRGAAESLHQRGFRVSQRPWHNLSLQHPQPSLAAHLRVRSDRFSAARPLFAQYDHCVHPGPVYDGGCSLKLSGWASPGVGFLLPLFRADVNLPSSEELVVAYAVVADDRAQLALALDFERPELGGASGAAAAAPIGVVQRCRVVLGRRAQPEAALAEAEAADGVVTETLWLGPEQVVNTARGADMDALKRSVQKLRGEGLSAAEIAARLRPGRRATGDWQERRYSVDLSRVAELCGTRALGVRLAAVTLGAFSALPAGDPTPPHELSAYLGSVSIAPAAAVAPPGAAAVSSMTASDAVVTGPPADRRLSLVLAWRLDEEHFGRRRRPLGTATAASATPSPYMYAVWYRSRSPASTTPATMGGSEQAPSVGDAPPSADAAQPGTEVARRAGGDAPPQARQRDEAAPLEEGGGTGAEWVLLGETRSTVWHVGGLGVGAGVGAQGCTFAVQVQWNDGRWESLDAAAKLRVDVACEPPAA